MAAAAGPLPPARQEGLLGGAVDGRDEGGQLALGQVLDLIDGEEDPAVAFPGGLAGGDEEVGDVLGEVAAVRRARQRVDVDGELGAVRELERERLQEPEGLEDPGSSGAG